tara:strand:+ start:322 stop:567 length:246 start_codon:yes stop_codon:yes gene_type:complete
MSKEVTAEFSKNDQKEAEWAYNKAMENFYYSMLEVIFLRIKSHLSQKGLNNILEIDKKELIMKILVSNLVRKLGVFCLRHG